MGRVKIVTDSTADLPKELVASYDITVVPLKVYFGNDEPLKDWVEIESEQFYRRQVEKGEMSRTSQPSPAEFLKEYTRLSSEGNSIISIHISSAMSGTCQSARVAKEALPDADIEVIDSKLVSMGLGLIVISAAQAAIDGKSKEEILHSVKKELLNTRVFFIVDTMEYLVRGGRIGKAKAFLGTILNIKPLLYLEDGLVQPYEKVRGKNRAVERLVQIVEEIAGAREVMCSVVHGADPTGQEVLRCKIAEKINCRKFILSSIGSVVGTHTGPGVLGVVIILM